MFVNMVHSQHGQGYSNVKANLPSSTHSLVSVVLLFAISSDKKVASARWP